MARRMESEAAKRIALIVLAIAIMLTLFSGCGTAGTQTTAPETSVQPAGSEAVSQLPETPSARPVDLLSDECNLFSDITFPEGYAIYAAGFENNVDFYFYDLYLTAAGNPEDIVTYISNLLGDSNEEAIQRNLDYYYNDGAVGIDGRLDEAGLDVNCKVTPTADEYDYDYVEGCSLRLRASIADPSDGDKMIEDNYNLNSLSDVAEFFDLIPITGKSKLYVRKLRNNVQIDAVYNTVEDVADVMERMKASLTYEGFDENNHVMNLSKYGEVSNNIYFDLDNNSISIFQNLDDAGKNYKDYEIASTKLTEYGFTNYIESDAMCEYKDDANNLSVAINIPAWGSRPGVWENSCVLFLKEINGYLLAIWYYPEEGKYQVQADKDETSAKFIYYETTAEFVEEFSTLDTVKEQFVNMFGDQAQEDVYRQCIDLFRNYINDTFGMSIDELYALATGE